MFIRVYSENRIIEAELNDKQQITIGNSPNDTISIDTNILKNSHIRVSFSDGVASFFSLTPVLFESQSVTEGRLTPARSVLVDKKNRIAFLIYERNHNNASVIKAKPGGNISIGRAIDNDIQLKDRAVSSKHLILSKTGDGWKVKNLSTTSGTYLNGTLVNEAYAKTDDLLDIGLCRIVLSTNDISIIAIHPPVNNLSHAKDDNNSKGNVKTEYPYLFKQSPRLIEKVKLTTIDLETAPTIGGKPKINWVSVIVPSLSTVLIMLILAVAITGALGMLFFSAPMAIIGVGMAIYNYRHQCKEYKKNEELRLQKYEEYLLTKEKEVEEHHKDQYRILNQVHPSTTQCLPIVTGPTRRLWERRVYDDDFLDLRVGTGELESCVEFKVPKKQLTLLEDELSNEAQNLADKYEKVKNCPIKYSARKFKTCGITGRREDAVSLAKNMIVQAATHHCYNDLKIVLIFNNEEADKWLFARWLPHIFDESRSIRYIVNNSSSAKRTLSLLEHEIDSNSVGGTSGEGPSHYLFIVADKSLVQAHTIYSKLVMPHPSACISSIFLFNELNNLPKECEIVIELKGLCGVLYNSFQAEVRIDFTADSVSLDCYEKFARAMAPLRVEPKQGNQALPTAVTFLEAYKTQRAKDLDIENRWGRYQPEKSMSVPIGARANGEAFYFDIHEKQFGPHGLVAGMTGSGKSEMVQSFILSMALHFSPQDVSFVLIDFKGTGLILPFKNLPHIAGTISDLDISITRNLFALENELSRRKSLFDSHGVSNISGYLKLYRQGKAVEPLSYMFIVIDEFAEFKIQYPEFMSVVNSVFATGRTLGVHIILLTQKPANVVDDKMHANTRFKWCLKVASSADSKEMLKHPDAAWIKNPGRAFVQVGEDELFEEIQSYYSGAPYHPHKDSSIQLYDKIAAIDLYANRTVYGTEKTTGYRSEENEIDAIVNYIDSYARANDIKRARNVWTKKLPDVIELSELLHIAFDGEHWSDNENRFSPVVGLIDDPQTQSQYPLQLDFLQDGHLSVYGSPTTGKTTFLHTAIMSTVLSYKPCEVNIYCLDFAGGSLNLFRDFPHVGAVVRDTEADKFNKLLKMLSDEFTLRRDKISSSGLINIQAYREVTCEEMPYILIAIDNFSQIPVIFPNSDQFFQNVSLQGASYGIYLLMTGGSQNAISFRVAQNVKSTIALQMADKNDYSAIVGNTKGLVPENVRGRGLVKGETPLEFQTAIPSSGSDSERSAGILNMAKLMREKWNGPVAAALPIMPDSISSSDYPNYGVLLGLETEKISPVYYDTVDAFSILVSSVNTAEGAELLGRLALQFADRTNNVKTACFCKHSPAFKRAETILSQGSLIDSYLDSLMPILQARKEQLDGNGNNNGDGFPPILIVIEDLEWVYSVVNDRSIQRISSILQLGEGLDIYLFINNSASNITKIYHQGDPITTRCIQSSILLLLGGLIKTHEILAIDVEFTKKETLLDKGFAYYIFNNKNLMLKAIDD